MKKKIIIPILVLVLVLLTIIITFYLKNLNITKEIKKSYNEYVTTNKEANLYNKEKNIIGTINENTYLELENTKIKSKNDIYFKIKNSDYYVFYKDINKTEQTSECKQIQLPIGGMSCAVCAKRVENGTLAGPHGAAPYTAHCIGRRRT